MTSEFVAVDLQTEPDFQIGDLTVRPSALEIVCKGKVRTIQKRPMEVLVVLAQSAGSPVGKTEFRDRCWGKLDLSDDVLHRGVSVIRNRFRSMGSALEIQNIRGVGYRLVVPRKLENAALPSEPQQAAAELSPTTGLGAIIQTLRGTRWPFAAAVLGAAGALMALVVAVRDNPASAPVYETVAVLPFDDFSRSGELGYLARGFAEEIRDGLDTSSDLRVLARASSRTADLTGKTPAEIADILGADLLIGGSITDIERTPRLSVSLISPETGHTIWSRSVGLSAETSPALSGQMVQDLLRAIDRDPAMAAPSAAPSDPALNEKMFKAKDYLAFGGSTSVANARRLFQEVAEADPNHAPAFIGLVEATLKDNSHRTHDEARMYLERAIQLDPWGQDTLIVEQLFNDHLRSEQIDEAELSRPNEPRRAAALDFSAQLRTLVVQSRYHEAERLVEEILEVDPIGAETNADVARVLSRRGQPEKALERLDLALSYSPNTLSLRFWRVNALAEMGDLSAAVGELIGMLEISPEDDNARHFLALLLGQLGFTPEALRVAPNDLQRLRALAASGEPGELFNVLAQSYEQTRPASAKRALTDILQHDLQSALEWLERIRDQKEASNYFEHPSDYKPYLSLAYRQAGQEDRADELDEEIFAEIEDQIAKGDESVVLFLPYQVLAAAARSDIDELCDLLDRAAAGGYVLFGLDDLAFDHLHDHPDFGTRYEAFRRIRQEQRTAIVDAGHIERLQGIISQSAAFRD